jgi:peptide-methionine (S)-S-oxide reductase
MSKIGFGGGCHWCTEAVFQSLIGIDKVEQGWIASNGNNFSFSEGVLIHFDNNIIDLRLLITIHLYTHSSMVNHAMRNKYRSAIYTFDHDQNLESQEIINDLQDEFDKPIITKVLPFCDFKLNDISYQDYYQKHVGNQFCERYINPKFNLIMTKFSKHVNSESINIKEFEL